MRLYTVISVALLFLVGCATPPAGPTELPAVSSADYDLLWDATRLVVEQHFELYAQRKDEGYMVSTYKRGEPFAPGSRRDAQTAYDTAEEFLHIVRRQLTARILEDKPGLYVVRLEVIRERQGYVPPYPDSSSTYSLYDPGKTGLDDAADQTETVTWYRLGRDLAFEKVLLQRIQAYLNQHPHG